LSFNCRIGDNRITVGKDKDSRITLGFETVTRVVGKKGIINYKRSGFVIGDKENCTTAFIGMVVLNFCSTKRKGERVAVIINCASTSSAGRSRAGRVSAIP